MKSPSFNLPILQIRKMRAGSTRLGDQHLIPKAAAKDLSTQNCVQRTDE